MPTRHSSPATGASLLLHSQRSGQTDSVRSPLLEAPRVRCRAAWCEFRAGDSSDVEALENEVSAVQVFN